VQEDGHGHRQQPRQRGFARSGLLTQAVDKGRGQVQGVAVDPTVGHQGLPESWSGSGLSASSPSQ